MSSTNGIQICTKRISKWSQILITMIRRNSNKIPTITLSNRLQLKKLPYKRPLWRCMIAQKSLLVSRNPLLRGLYYVLVPSAIRRCGTKMEKLKDRTNEGEAWLLMIIGRNLIKILWKGSPIQNQKRNCKASFRQSCPWKSCALNLSLVRSLICLEISSRSTSMDSQQLELIVRSLLEPTTWKKKKSLRCLLLICQKRKKVKSEHSNLK